MSDNSLSTTRSIGLAMLLALAPWAALSCSGEQYTEKKDELVELPDTYGDVPLETRAAEGFCSNFDDPALADLMEKTFRQNMDLRAAWARIRQAEAAADVTDANLWPRVTADASASRRKTSSSFGGDGQTGGLPQQSPDEDSSTTFNSFETGLGASYEVDLWGRLASERQAADYDAAAAHADAHSLAITMASQLSETWFDALHQQQRVLLLESQLEVSEKFLELTRLRLSQGAASALDVSQQKQQLESVRGQLTQASSARDTSLNAIAVFLGQTPGSVQLPDDGALPTLPPAPSPGVPADLLMNRPDIRAALFRLQAADARTAAAARARLPQLTLSARLFFEASEISNLFDELLWSIAGNATQSVFEGGRKQAQLRRSEAAAEAQLYAYGQVLLSALRDVRNALLLEHSQIEFIDSLEKQLESARTVLDLARLRYRSGATNYLRVLTAIQSLQQTELSLLNARRQRLSSRVQLCRALGGRWAAQIEPASFGEGADE